MYWLALLDRLHSMPADHASREIDAMSADDVIAFWRWNDNTARAEIDAADASEIPEIADSLRETLRFDVTSEIAYRTTQGEIA